MTRIGVISDTHSMVRPEALIALAGVDHIIHAGDIGSPSVIDELRRIAPVTAIRGNVDTGEWARQYPETELLQLDRILVYVIHNLDNLALDPLAAGFAAVIHGHSHIPLEETRSGVLYFNPGSAGPRRFHLPISLGFLTILGRRLSPEILEIGVGPEHPI